jgi:hypothetical protein
MQKIHSYITDLWDSDVYMVDNWVDPPTCRKEYANRIRPKTVSLYTQLQDHLWKISFDLKFREPFMIDWNCVEGAHVQLPSYSKIESGRTTISPFVLWKSILEMREEHNKDNTTGICPIAADNIIYWIRSELASSLDFNFANYKRHIWGIALNESGTFPPINAGQLSNLNIKYLDYDPETRYAKIVITDIASNVNIFIYNNREKIVDLLE